MRKLASLLLALVMVFSLATAAFADGDEDEIGTSVTDTTEKGTITIENAVVGHTYTIYEILYLESYNATKNAEAYSYKATSAWKSFVESDAIKDVYLATDTQGYVTWVKDEDGAEADAAAFAKLAKAYAADTKNNISNQGSTTATSTTEGATTTTVKFENLELGYYLVDSTLGTLCSLDTTNPNVTIKEKNKAPENEKTVKEDSTGEYGKTNDADIGQDVEFKSTVQIPKGSENVVFKDQMSAGLTLKADSIKVYTDADLTTALADTNYTLTTENLTGITFQIAFNQTYLDSLTAVTTTLYVVYTATVNENAGVALPGNTNGSWLDYGETGHTQSTPQSQTITYTWDLDVLKYGNSDESKVLKDAQFVLIKKVTEGENQKECVATIVNGKLTGWADVPTAGEDGTITWPANTILTTNDNGKIEIDGLDADTYYLREIKAPAGYNKLAKDEEVKITGATKGEGDALTYTTVVAKVNNQSGTELPSTGGVGTTLFYVLGSILVLAAAVLLVTKKRMSAEN